MCLKNALINEVNFLMSIEFWENSIIVFYYITVYYVVIGITVIIIIIFILSGFGF